TSCVIAPVISCSITAADATSAPTASPPAPLVNVTNNCGNSVLSTTAAGSLLWSPGGATTSSITVTNAATYSVTATVNGCTSTAGTATSAPVFASTPVVTVVDNCGSSTLSTTATGS